MDNKQNMTEVAKNLNKNPVNLPEELQKLLDQNKDDEEGCAECYSSAANGWTNMTPDMPDLLKKEMDAMNKEVEKDPHEKVIEQIESIEESYVEELEEQHVERLHQQIVRDNANGFWKYEEDETLKELQDYLSGTYRSHYTSQESKTQTLDLIESIGDAEPFCRSNAIKYLSRFGKKNGKSKLDILKAMHYCVLLYHFAGLHKKSTDNYETF
jgi:hypothetical protein